MDTKFWRNNRCVSKKYFIVDEENAYIEEKEVDERRLIDEEINIRNEENIKFTKRDINEVYRNIN